MTLMAEWLQYASFALNCLLLPLMAVLWSMSQSIAKLEVQTGHCAEETKELRAEISAVKTQVTTAALAAASAATTLATAVADIRISKK